MNQLSPSLPRDYADILQILPRLPEPDRAAGHACLAGMADMPPEQRAYRAWLAQWQGGGQPRLHHPRLSVFAANHGVAHLMPPAVTAAEILAGLTDPAAPLGQAVAAADADLRLYEMNLAASTEDMTRSAAMDRRTCLHAMIYGMMAAEMGLDVLALAACGDGQSLSATVLLSVVLERDVSALLAMMDMPVALAATLRPVTDRIRNLPPCEMLEQAGGPEIAAMLGAMLAARMAHIPVIVVDGAGLAALALLMRLDPLAGRHVALAGSLAAFTAWPELLRIPSGAERQAGLAAVRAVSMLQDVA